MEEKVQKTKVFRVKVDFDKGIAFENLCKHESTNVNAKLKELMDSSLKGQKRYFQSGKNKFVYNQVNNSFKWLVQLDNGKEVEILNNLSLDFLNDLKESMTSVIIERNNWVHQGKKGSVNVPSELLEARK